MDRRYNSHMCGRYTITGPDDIAERFKVTLPGPIEPNYNAAPSQDLPVITETGDGKKLEIMRWGLIPVWAKDNKIGYKLINARAESVFDKPMWKKLVTSQRCLIPANGFYEWKKQSEGGKQPYYIHLSSNRYDQPMYAFAGLWSTWHDPERDGATVHSYSILTTRPNAEMEAIHDRMPVILHPDDEADWLNPDMTESTDIEQFLRPLDDGALEMYEVSKDVNVVKVNRDTLILPVNSA
jgi:putative SOS response-associated peptidase YedK